MNGRRLYREYAQTKGMEAVGFKSITLDYYGDIDLITYDSKGKEEYTRFNGKAMIDWIIKTKKLQEDK